jgi:hypothetical protein
LTVDVDSPEPVNGLEVVTELSSFTGTIADPFARETTYVCAFDISGEVEVCVTTTYEDPDADDDDDDGSIQVRPKRRGPNVYFTDPLECSTTRCTVIVCPEEKNVCPEVESLTIDPDMLEEGEVADVIVAASDPDDNPGPLTTKLTARHGEIADPDATVTTYECDEDVGGIIPICVDVSDGACTETVCEGVRCPGIPLENTCPIVESISVDPNPILPPNDTTTVSADAQDPDEFPDQLTLTWSSEGGGFEDRNAATTTFRCTQPGRTEVCVQAEDGDEDCLDDEQSRRCTFVECPGEVQPNVCPNLNVISTNPTVIPEGSNFTTVETRGWDTDKKPFPMTLTLSALWGTFQNTENKMCEPNDPNCLQSPNVTFQDAIYLCDRPGPVELCVEATDGVCVKTQCTDVFCPDDL